jgi:hypothetical protein
MNVLKYPSIEQFRNVRRHVEWRAQVVSKDEATGEWIMDRNAKLPTLTFLGTEKIHGSNCSARFFKDGGIVCQSRERIITPEDDNYGFARFIKSLPTEALNTLMQYVPDDVEIVIYGEWAGKGIQNIVAVTELEKFWVIFGAKVVSAEDDDDIGWVDIRHWETPEDHRIFNIYKSKTWEVEVDFNDQVKMAEAIEKMNALTLEVEKESPLALKIGNVSGVGEGIVWMSITKPYMGPKFIHKVKGSQHSASKVTKLANVDPEKLRTVGLFIDKHVHEGRLQQGWDNLHETKTFNYENSMGLFLSWIFNDIMKEEADELEASGFGKKDVSPAIAKKAKVWYFEKLKSVDTTPKTNSIAA